MYSVQCLREFIKERLNAVCEEIFLEVQKTVGHYEEEIDRQRRLLDMSRKPDTNSHITALPQPKEHSLDEQQVCNQERNSSLDQMDPEPPQITDKQAELCSSQEGEQLGLKQEPEGIWTDEERHTLPETIWKPEIKLYVLALPQPHDCEKEHSLDEQQVCNQERNSSLNQADTEPPKIKEEQEELCSSQEGEQLGLKQEPEGIWTDEERHTLPEAVWKPEIKLYILDLKDSSSQEGEQLGLKQESDHSQSEPNREQLLSHISPEAERKDEEESQHVDSGSTRNAELKKRRYQRKRSHSHIVENTPVSEGQSQTDTRKESVQCDICGKTFQQKSHLKRHLVSHTGEKPYSCSTCGKRFTDISASIRHMKNHTDKKQFPCSTCGKVFGHKADLERHIRIHTGEKPYACSTCGKRFSDISAFVRHVRIHTGEKPYSCGTCGKRFNQTGNLKTHMRIHGH